MFLADHITLHPYPLTPLPPYPLILADRAGETYPNRICRTSSKSYAQQTLDLALDRLTHILGRCFASYSIVSIYTYTQAMPTSSCPIHAYVS